jgi:ABC-type polysaccharide/polyol phosphate export permease
MWTKLCFNEIRRRYRRTLLGPAWVTISLLLFATAMSIVWSGLWKQKVSDFLPFLLSGLLPWTMISGIIGESCTVFLSGEALVKNQRFPFSVLIYSGIARHLILFMHNLIAYFFVLVLCGVPFNYSMALLLAGIILVVINCAWISLIIAIACMRFRDLKEIVQSILQISMFITPVFWEASQLQGNRAFIVDFNPLHHLIEIVREPMLGKIPEIMSYLFCIGFAIGGWMMAYWFFDKKRGRLAYWY